MPHFFVPSRNIRGRAFFFNPSESRHLSKVLRKKAGDVVQIFDGEGGVLSARITDCSDPARVAGEILEPAPAPSRPPSGSVPLAVFPALIRSERFEWALEKLTELGVGMIFPLTTERTIVALNARQAESKLERWRKVSLAAAKQCGRADLPEIAPVKTFSQALREARTEHLSLILWEGESESRFAEALTPPTSGPPGRINLFVGPEGGFSVQEVDQAKSSGVLPVHLGQNILRAETAAIAAASRVLLR